LSLFQVHRQDPSDAVEQAYFRIQQERMAGVPIVNPALRVEAVDFQRWQGHWLGVVITPWCMSVLLVPGRDGGWTSARDNQRRFVKFPYGDLAFLGGDEPELGEFQSCALFSPMDKFSAQAQALATARASMLALLAPPPAVQAIAPPVDRQASRRRFLRLGESTRA